MTAAYQYYELKEKDVRRVSVVWKALHSVIFALICISSFLSSYTFGRVMKVFDDNCVLHAIVPLKSELPENVDVDMRKRISDVELTTISDLIENQNISSILDMDVTTLSALKADEKATSDLTEDTPKFDRARIQWGDMETCYAFHIFEFVSMIAGLVFFVFVSVVSRGGAGFSSDILPRPYQIVLPMAVFSAIFVLCLMITDRMLLTGFTEFCKQFPDNTEKCTPKINEYIWELFGNTDNTYILFEVASTASTISLYLWIGQLSAFLIRYLLVVDFQVHLVSVKQNKFANDMHSDDEETFYARILEIQQAIENYKKPEHKVPFMHENLIEEWKETEPFSLRRSKLIDRQQTSYVQEESV